MLPKAILFDLDDTIITEGDRLVALQDVACEFAAELGPHRPDRVAVGLDEALQAFWSDPEKARVARLGPGGSGIAEVRLAVISAAFQQWGLAELASRFCERFAALRAQRHGFFPGARETVAALRDEGVRLALVTNGAADMQRAKIERYRLAGLFDHIQIEGEHGFGKPDRRAYDHALARLGARPEETWMVGDNLEWEVAAPQRLGIFAIWHDPFGRGLPAASVVRPDRIIRQLPELLDRVAAPG